MARQPDLRSVALREGLGRPRGGSVRVGFGTTARHSRVAFAWVPARPHLQPGGRAVCWFLLHKRFLPTHLYLPLTTHTFLMGFLIVCNAFSATLQLATLYFATLHLATLHPATLHLATLHIAIFT